MTISRSAQHGLITGTTLGTVTDSRTYNTFGELQTYTSNASGSPVYSVIYTRDKLGRITQKIEGVGGTADTYDYSYDVAGRLKDVTKNGTINAVYGYDSNGNLISYTTPVLGTIGGVYDAQDRLTDYGQLQFTYTANGELLTKSNPNLGQTATYSYDVLGNLKSVILPGSVTIDYVVDGQNRRIGKKVNGTLVQGFLYQNQLNPVAELDGTGAVVSRFVYGTKANVPDYMVKGGVTYRIVSDHLGSPRLVVNTSTGAVAQRMDYDEFGNITADTAPGFQPFGFAGGLYDQQTGLTRFGARDYDAQVGRWTAKDPIGFAGGQPRLYGYAFDDPIDLLDSNGLKPACPGCIQECLKNSYGELADYSFDASLFGLFTAAGITGLEIGAAKLGILEGVGGVGGELGANYYGKQASDILSTPAEAYSNIFGLQVRGARAASATRISSTLASISRASFAMAGKLANGGLVVTAGATGFYIGAKGYCELTCLGE